MNDHDPSDLGPDLTICDREPIHTPASIQPHGLLLVADGSTLSVIAGAGDIEGRLAQDWLYQPLDQLVGRDLVARLTAFADQGTIALGHLRGPAHELFDVVAHRSAETVFVELEPAADVAVSATQVLLDLDAASATFERASNLRELCIRAVKTFRQMTGFDRVMLYRFLDDEAGVVLAEDKVPELGTFLNHHFPASDIPKQARALYVRNRVRVIPDVGYGPAPLRPASNTLAMLDLSDVSLRSVSPIHVQYLKNMDVQASASISIVKDGLLWGLIACHNRTPKTLTYDVRIACRTLAGGLARQIRAKDEAELYRERIRLRTAEDAVVSRLGSDLALDDFLASTGEDLCRMLAADGFAAVQGKDLYVFGHCPDRADVREVAGWVKDRAAAVPFSTFSLGQHFEPSRAYQDLASGLLAVTMSTEVPTILLWFRAEQIEVVNWAGNPHKAVTVDPNATLEPRTSFEAWTESVRGRSTPWTLGEIEAANRLRTVIFESRQNQRVRNLNRDLTLAIGDKEALLLQKDYLLKEVNHRVQNSLQLVSAFLAMQSRAVGDATLTQHLSEAQRRISAVSLVHRRLYTDDRIETVDLARYLEELATEMRASMGPEWDGKITLDLAPILISTDRAVKVGLILTELVINSNKYAYGGEPGPIAIGLEQHRSRFRLSVADRGPGKVQKRQGFGTRIMNSLIDQLSGSIDESSNDPGLCVVVTAPIQAD